MEHVVAFACLYATDTVLCHARTEKEDLEKQKEAIVIENEAVIAEYYQTRQQLEKVPTCVSLVCRGPNCADSNAVVQY